MLSKLRWNTISKTTANYCKNNAIIEYDQIALVLKSEPQTLVYEAYPAVPPFRATKGAWSLLSLFDKTP
jgi:hypothetical protein